MPYHEVEVAQVPVGDQVAAAAGGTAGGEKLHVHNGAEHVVAPKPPLVILKLAQDLNRGLSTVFLVRGTQPHAYYFGLDDILWDGEQYLPGQFTPRH